MSQELLKEIKRLNENLEWLKGTNTHLSKEYINIKESMSLLDRKRTWIQTRMVIDLEEGQDPNSVLIRDVDWIREGNRLMFKQQSILRLKKTLLMDIGNKYEQICR